MAMCVEKKKKGSFCSGGSDELQLNLALTLRAAKRSKASRTLPLTVRGCFTYKPVELLLSISNKRSKKEKLKLNATSIM